MSAPNRRADLLGERGAGGDGCVYVAAALGLIGYALGYALPAYARLPRLVYDPVARHFYFRPNVGEIPLGYFGLVLSGAVVGLVFAALGYALATRWVRSGGGAGAAVSARAIGLLAAWALTALGLVGSWFSWNNWP